MEDSKTNKELKEASDKFYFSILLAVKISRTIHGKPGHIRLALASALLVRLCVIGESIYKLVPGNRLSKAKRENWDSSSIMILCRSFIECYHTLFYLCFENIREDEWKCRRLILNLHDCTEREKFFAYSGKPDANFETTKLQLQEDLKNDPFFKGIKPQEQKKFLKGEKAFLFDRYELEERIGNEKAKFREIYKFFSQHTHSMTMSFYRMLEQDRGRGVENEADKSYIIYAINIATEYLQKSLQDMLCLFPDLSEILSNQDLEMIKNENERIPGFPEDPEAIKALADLAVRLYEWKVEKKEDGEAIMHLDTPYDNLGKIEYLTLSLGKKGDAASPKWISFTLPTDVDETKGISIHFANNHRVDGKFNIEFVDQGPINLGFSEIKPEFMSSIGLAGIFLNKATGKEIDFLPLLLAHDHIHLTFYHKKGKEIRKMIPLFSFKEKYGNL